MSLPQMHYSTLPTRIDKLLELSRPSNTQLVTNLQLNMEIGKTHTRFQ